MDTHADEEGVGVGGWWPQTNDRGQATTWDIATLEALGLLLVLLAFGQGESLDNTALKIQVAAFTDNKENGCVINKLMTTRFP